MPFETIYSKKYRGRVYFYLRKVAYRGGLKRYNHLKKRKATLDDFVRLGKKITEEVFLHAQPGHYWDAVIEFYDGVDLEKWGWEVIIKSYNEIMGFEAQASQQRVFIYAMKRILAGELLIDPYKAAEELGLTANQVWSAVQSLQEKGLFTIS